MRLTLKCPGCNAALPVDAAVAPQAVRCGRCARDIPLRVTEPVRTDSGVDACPVCGGTDFYTRKDFNPTIGVAVVAVGALISGVFYWFGRDLMAYGVLAGAVAVDFAIALMIGSVTVCYRCHAEFRGRYRRTAPAFDLHIADVLEQEYERKIGRR